MFNQHEHKLHHNTGGGSLILSISLPPPFFYQSQIYKCTHTHIHTDGEIEKENKELLSPPTFHLSHTQDLDNRHSSYSIESLGVVSNADGDVWKNDVIIDT